MEKILTYKGAVMSWECDSNQHMNVMYYINKYELAGRNFDIELGLFQEGLPTEKGIVVLEQTINYYQEVFEDDLLYIKSVLVHIGNKAFKVKHEMYNTRTEKLVSKMDITLTLFDKIKRRALPFPLDRKEILIKKWNLGE